jgi:signal transduction histidine kinase/DNA-binding NarL/FixJ family response regulator
MDSHSIRLLVIEDAKQDIRLIKELLRDSNNYYFILESTPYLEKGLNKLSSDSFDAVLLDLNLPDSHGIETLYRALSQENKPPIIILTGLDDKKTAIKAVKFGAQDYLVKGNFNSNQIIRSILYSIERKNLKEQLKDLNQHLEEKVAKKTKLLNKSEYNLKERVKKLNCLYNISKNLDNTELTIYEILEESLKLIPRAFQFPDHCETKIKLEKKEFETNSFEKIKTRIEAEIQINNKLLKIIVGYIKDFSFLNEEKLFLEELVNRFKSIIERKLAYEKRLEAEKMIKLELKKLKELDQLKNEFIFRVSHELKTPLTSIYSTIDLILSHYTDHYTNKVNHLLKIIERGGFRLKKLIENLLNISQIEYGKLKADIRKENLTKLIKGTLLEILPFASQRNLSITQKIPEDIYAEVDKDKVEEIIFNILTNAIKNTPKGGQIIIKLKEMENRYEIIVEDTGVGFTKEEKKKVFKKFGKIERYGKNMDVNIEGSGLGLYLSKKFIELHNGEILLKSQGRDEGSKFIIHFPKSTQYYHNDSNSVSNLSKSKGLRK